MEVSKLHLLTTGIWKEYLFHNLVLTFENQKCKQWKYTKNNKK